MHFAGELQNTKDIQESLAYIQAGAALVVVSFLFKAEVY